MKLAPKTLGLMISLPLLCAFNFKSCNISPPEACLLAADLTAQASERCAARSMEDATEETEQQLINFMRHVENEDDFKNMGLSDFTAILQSKAFRDFIYVQYFRSFVDIAANGNCELVTGIRDIDALANQCFKWLTSARCEQLGEVPAFCANQWLKNGSL